MSSRRLEKMADDPQGIGRRLLGGLAGMSAAGARKRFAILHNVSNGGIRMGRRGRGRKPPTMEEYMMADRFIGAMVGLNPGEWD